MQPCEVVVLVAGIYIDIGEASEEGVDEDEDQKNW